MREDVIALYGFATGLEQDLFERLIAHQRHRAEAGAGGSVRDRAGRPDRGRSRLQDVARLTSIPGIGKKTAERIGLELKDRLPTTSAPGGRGRRQPATPARISCVRTLLSALLNLGYQRPAAEKAIEKALKAAS